MVEYFLSIWRNAPREGHQNYFENEILAFDIDDFLESDDEDLITIETTDFTKLESGDEFIVRDYLEDIDFLQLIHSDDFPPEIMYSEYKYRYGDEWSGELHDIYVPLPKLSEMEELEDEGIYL